MGGIDGKLAATVTSLGLGTMATQDANAVAITGGSVTGITDITAADGGTGRSSHTAYSVLCGGTTATAAQQSVASVGGAGEVLTSNGAAALPTFQAAGGGGGAAPFPFFQFQLAGYWSMAYSGTSPVGVGVTDSRLYIAPFQQTSEITLTNVGVGISGGVAGSTARLGLYSMSMTTGDFTLVTDYGTVSTASSGVSSVAATDVLDVNTRYCYAITVDENAGSVTIQGINNTVGFYYKAAIISIQDYVYKDGISAGSALPATVTFASTTGATNAVPVLMYQ